MFIKSFKVKKNFSVVAAAAVIVLLGVILFVSLRGRRQSVYSLKSENDRQAFIKDMGWETDDEYYECKVVIIPEEWNDVYTRYNELQKEQGFDLEKYKGETAEIYTYKVHNYKGYEDSEDVYINLYISDGVLIGGDVCCTRLDGFMQGLKSDAADK
ncbi:MAG: DUF4830 domain-containing protein [Ruminococcus sp.]|nr:DUF4830 domain-containing protein [Ruminococcus sp.]